MDGLQVLAGADRAAANHGFSARELKVIRSYIEEYLTRLVEAWGEHCGS